ncbi:unnamed protein product, partial [Protopolystoma xenopodis]
HWFLFYQAADDDALNTSNSAPVLPSNEYEERICWLCYVSESESDPINQTGWCRPCSCRGATGWIHQSCLQRWIDDQQHGDIYAKVNCKVSKIIQMGINLVLI